ncbi:hypothetical protein HDU92_006071 [Lobulomyces angularis]|nr:hypothetical protein HDU92_006071 [Lobulomyces angularis]
MSMPEISCSSPDDPDAPKVARVPPQPISLYTRFVYALDILIPTKKTEQEIIIPPGSYLQKVIYGKLKKLRVMKNPTHGLPSCLVEEKDVETYRVIEDKDTSGWYNLIDPQSPFMRKWDNTTMILLLFTACVAPFEVAFIPTNYEIDLLFLVNRAIDLCFIYDITLQFRIPFRDTKTGMLVNEKGAIIAAYLKSWFFIDFVSIFPFEFIGWGSHGDNSNLAKLSLFRIMKLARLLKLLRVLRASRKLQRFRVNSRISYPKIQLYTFMTILVFLIHWLACGFRLASDKNDPIIDRPGWVDRFATYNHVNVTTLTISEVYMLALYWSCSTVTLIGTSYPPLQADNIREWDQREHELKIDKYLGMFYNFNLNPAIKYKVHEYLTDQNNLKAESEYQGLIKALPQQWSGIINLEIFLPFLARIPYLEPFLDKEPGLIIDLCKNIEMVAIPPNSFLFSGGLNGIYLIEKGIVAIDGTVYVRGDIIGKSCLRFKIKKNEGRALTNVVAQYIPKDTLETMLGKHKKMRYYSRRWTAWEILRKYLIAYKRLYLLAAKRGSLMSPPMISKRGNMDDVDFDDIDLAVMEHMEEYGFF